MARKRKCNCSLRISVGWMNEFIRSQERKKDFVFSPLELAILGRCSYTEGKEMEKKFPTRG